MPDQDTNTPGKEVRMKKYDFRISVTSAVISLISAVVVALIGWWGKSEIESLNAALKKQEIELMKDRFADEIARRKEENLKDYIPKVLSGKEEERMVGKAVLFTLYPNEAVNVMISIENAITDSTAKKSVRKITTEAQRLSSQIGEWGIVAGADKTLDAAQYEVGRAHKQGYSDVKIYLRDNVYRTVIGPFGTQDEARIDLIEVKQAINKSAYVVNMNSWCSSAKSNKGEAFWTCE